MCMWYHGMQLQARDASFVCAREPSNQREHALERLRSCTDARSPPCEPSPPMQDRFSALDKEHAPCATKAGMLEKKCQELEGGAREGRETGRVGEGGECWERGAGSDVHGEALGQLTSC